MKFKDKYFYAGITVVCLAFGFATCDVGSFICGLFAGMAAILTVDIWMEDS